MARILVVEDNPQQLSVRCLLLELSGHEVFPASSASDAMSLLSLHCPEVLLMDLCLPKVEDGLALLRAGAHQPFALRIVVLSGWPEELYEKPEAALAAHILVKPVATRILLEAVGS
jgi:CheY-like chemotaxis protein